MEATEKTAITVKVTVNAPIEKVWKFWTDPKHITKWCQASDDWHAPHAENDVRNGGKFKTTMAAKDGSVSFDFAGVYTAVEPNKLIAYIAGDGRKVNINFASSGKQTTIVETFEAENENPIEMQQAGWQAILDSFKKHTEGN